MNRPGTEMKAWGEAATQYGIEAISNNALKWIDDMANLPLSSLLKIAKMIKRDDNLSHIIIEYINSDFQRVTSEIVAKLLDLFSFVIY
jgi:hypothetical protein